MKKLTRWIAAKVIKDYQDTNDPTVRARYGSFEGWVSIVINILLFIIKIVIGLSIKSISLIADAVHTLADSATSAMVIIGFKIAKKPSDKEHPFGHGRMEFVATLIVSVLLFVAGVELLEKSVHSVIQPQTSAASLGVILIIVGTIIVKELLSRFSYELGEIIDSQTLKADALHHRTDAITTVLVVVALIASRFGYSRIDGIMGLFVSFIIFYSAYLIAKEAIHPLLGEAPSNEALIEIEELARTHHGVLGIHDIIIHNYGQTTVISLHIEVSAKESAFKLHELSEAVEEDIAKKVCGMVTVHIDPVNKDHPKYETIARTIKEVISEDSRVRSFHDLRIIGCGVDNCKVVFDIVLEDDADEQERHGIIISIQGKVNHEFPEVKIVIRAQPRFAYSIEAGDNRLP